MRITVVSNNYTTRRGFVAEHGLSLLVNWQGKRVLFDVGQGLALPTNLGQLRRSLKEIEGIALSHGHYDHGGALEWMAIEGSSNPPPLYAHPDAFLPRFRRENRTLQRISIPSAPGGTALWPNLRTSAKPQQLLPGLWLSGEIQPRHAEEEAATEFLIDRGQGTEPDPFLDDQALFAETKSGVVILTGCAHSGLIAVIERVLALSSHRRVQALIGGFHLGNASSERIDWTLNALEQWNIPLVVPMHCTGFEATRRLKNAFPEAVRTLGAGERIDIDDRR